MVQADKPCALIDFGERVISESKWGKTFYFCLTGY